MYKRIRDGMEGMCTDVFVSATENKMSRNSMQEGERRLSPGKKEKNVAKRTTQLFR